MGGGWSHPTGSKSIRTAERLASTTVTYGEVGWPSQSWALWAFDYRDTDLY